MNLFAPNGVHHPINPVASEYLYHVIAFEIGRVSKMAQNATSTSALLFVQFTFHNFMSKTVLQKGNECRYKSDVQGHN